MSQKLSDKILSGDFIRIFSIDFLLYCRYCGIRRSLGKARTSAHCPHKKESCLQDSPPAAGRESDMFIFAAVRSPGEFLFNREFLRNFLLNKKSPRPSKDESVKLRVTTLIHRLYLPQPGTKLLYPDLLTEVCRHSLIA